MDADLYSQVLTQGGWVDLSDRAKWRLTGADRVRYLNGQVTNDVRQALADRALYACVTNAKGRIEGDVFIHASADNLSLLLDAPAGLRETLGPRLERYIIADDVELADVTPEWRLWHGFGAAAAQADGLPLPPEGLKLTSSRYGVAGADIWLPAAAAPPVLSGPVLSAAEAEDFRILQGVPGFPGELNPEVFPQEAGLEKNAMSFTKGCYIGQEILSRIKTTGKMPREMLAWEAMEITAEIAAGDAFHLQDAPGKVAGSVTSVTRHPVSGVLAGLGFVRHGAAPVDSVLLVGDGVPRIAASVKISALLNQ